MESMVIFTGTHGLSPWFYYQSLPWIVYQRDAKSASHFLKAVSTETSINEKYINFSKLNTQFRVWIIVKYCSDTDAVTLNFNPVTFDPETFLNIIQNYGYYRVEKVTISTYL